MIGSISNSAAQAGCTVLIKVTSETAQVSNTSKDQVAPSSQGGDSLKISTLAQQLSNSNVAVTNFNVTKQQQNK